MNTSRRDELIENLRNWCATISKTRGDACISAAASLIQSPTSYRLFTSTPNRALEKRIRELNARPSFAGMVDELAHWLCDAGFTHEADDIRAKCAKMQKLSGDVLAGSEPDRVLLRRKANELRSVLEQVRLRFTLKVGEWVQNHPDQPDERRRVNTDRFVFRREGDGYNISGFGENGHVSATGCKGLHVIHRLVQTPGKVVQFHELNRLLAKREPQAKANADLGELVNKYNDGRPGLSRDDRPSVQKALTPEEISDLQRLLEDPDISLEQREEIESYLRASRDHRGKPRDLQAPRQKYAPRIRGLVNSACNRLRTAKPPMSKLAKHFHASIHESGGTGFEYAPTGEPIPWKTI
jgi:hypothetical protein